MTVNQDDVRRWVAAGIIDEATAARLVAFEEARAAERQARAERPGVVELLVYLAAAITAAGVTVLAATNWEHLASAPRIAIPAVSAAAVFAAGEWLRRTGSAALLRGASLLWLLAGALAVRAVAIAAGESGASENDTALAAGVAALIVSLALWFPIRMHPQVVGLAGAEFLFAMAVGSRAAEDWVMAALGIVLALFGAVGLVAVESGILVPRSSARLLAALGLAVGAFWAGLPPSPTVMELLGVVVVILLVAAGIRFQSLVYVALGVVTAFAGMLQLILRHIESPTVAGLALIAIGLLLLLSVAGLRKTQPWSRTRASTFGLT